MINVTGREDRKTLEITNNVEMKTTTLYHSMTGFFPIIICFGKKRVVLESKHFLTEYRRG